MRYWDAVRPKFFGRTAECVDLITFYQLIQGGFPPRLASQSANGTLPTDGFRYCEPLRAASSFGWYVYLPVDLWLLWDGCETQWSLDEGQTWYPLAEAIQYPGFSNEFDDAAPEACRGYAPPFLTRGVEHDILQVWTGVVAATEPDICALVRGPANLSWRTDFSVLEGIIETDRWFGPLFTNIRLRKIDSPIVFRGIQPFLQVQPVPKAVLNHVMNGQPAVHGGLVSLEMEQWERFEATVVHRMKTRKRLGDYAVEVRKKRRSSE